MVVGSPQYVAEGVLRWWLGLRWAGCGSLLSLRYANQPPPRGVADARSLVALWRYSSPSKRTISCVRHARGTWLRRYFGELAHPRVDCGERTSHRQKVSDIRNRPSDYWHATTRISMSL